MAAPSAPPAPPSIEEDWSEVDLSATPGPGAPALDIAEQPASAIRGGLPKPVELEVAPPPPAPIELGELGPEAGEPELAPMHTFVPPPEATGHKPEAAEPKADDAGEAQLRDALGKASREVIEKIVWEVVPQLAEAIIRENLDRLLKERQKQ